jgi:hypothetical protein
MTSTIKADVIEAATGTNTDLTLQGKGTGVVNLSAGSKLDGVALTDTFSTQSPANPNLIINGDMRIAQRGTSFTGIAGANPYTLDRWQFKANGLVEGVYSVAQETSVVPAKFSSALKATCTTAEVTAGASYRASLRYSVEGYDASDLDWGSAEAQQVTISFKVRSSLIGTYCVALSNGTRTIRKEYTISVADTWEEKTLTFAGDTTGTWAVNNTQGVEVQFALGVGANLNAGTDNTWETNDDIATASQVDWGGTLNATFYLTGVKLEVGSTATAFVPDNYSTAMAKCQRYFQLFGFGMPASCDLTTNVSIPFHTSVPMRTTSPTFVIENTSFQIRSNNAVRTASSPAVVGATAGDGSGFWKQINGLASLTGGHAGLVYTVNAFSADAEL